MQQTQEQQPWPSNDRPQSLPAPITNHTDNYVHTIFRFHKQFKIFFQIPVCTSRRAECKERAVTASQERGLLSLKQRGR